uniref:G_PROTEIN_RECEP_F1_2 domain-containing protein n=1 Tax=Parastrongyloides trichosuri TaxID=131310 RepID=A0A0N4Z9B4_PARTI
MSDVSEIIYEEDGDTYTDFANLTDEEYFEQIVRLLMPSKLEYFFGFIFIIQMIVGVVGNCMVVYVVAKNKNMWTSMNLFLTNLALSDMLVLIFCLPPTVINDLTKTFWFSSALCKSISLFQNTSVYVSVLTLMFIAIERWKAISSPLSLPLWKTSRVIFIIWTLAFILSSPEPYTLRLEPFDLSRQKENFTWGTKCTESWSPEFQKIYQLSQTVICFLIPLIIITALCLHMVIILRRKGLQLGERQIASRKRATNMLMLVVLVFFVCYLPVHLHNIATAFNINYMDDDEDRIAIRKFIPRFLVYSSCSLNPILYNFMSERFRREMTHVCCLAVTTKDGKKTMNRIRYSSLTGPTYC